MQLKTEEASLIIDVIIAQLSSGNTLELAYYDLLKRLAYEFPEYENTCNAYIDDEQKSRQIPIEDIDCL